MSAPATCPTAGCGRALKWRTIYVSGGEGYERRPLWEAAECRCGLRLEYDAGQPHLRTLRENARLDREEAAEERSQMEIL